MNCNSNTFTGKYVSLIESETPWYNSDNILLTKKNIKKNNKYPNNCTCEKYKDLEECSCIIENMTNINSKKKIKDNVNKNDIIKNDKNKNRNNDINMNKNKNKNNDMNKNKNKNNDMNKNKNKNNDMNKNNLNKNIIKMILLIFFILIILNVIIK